MSAWLMRTWPSLPLLAIAWPVWFQVAQLMGPWWLVKDKIGVFVSIRYVDMIYVRELHLSNLLIEEISWGVVS